MTINSPEEMVVAIHNMLLQMNRKQRKNFLVWVKKVKNKYDFTYPEGISPKENSSETSAQPVISVPSDSGSSIILPPNYVQPSGDGNATVSENPSGGKA